jgi:hypothetical protein
MARIKFPTELIKQYQLFTKMKAKHDADALTSVLIPFLTEQGIDLTDDENDTNTAAQLHLRFTQHEKDAEEQTEKRNHLFDPVFKNHRDCVQFLKKLYRGNVQRLGEWWVTVDNNNRIAYPPDFLGRLLAVGKFLQKYATYAPSTSPLEVFLTENNIDLAANATAINSAQAANDSAIDHNAQKEQLREERDTLFDPVAVHLRGIGEFLVGLFEKNPHKAGQWGFEIDSSPQADKIRNFKLSAGEIKTVINVALNSEVINTSAVTLFIKPKNKPNATPVALEPNKHFKVIFGYGGMAVQNGSNNADGSFEATFTK